MKVRMIKAEVRRGLHNSPYHAKTESSDCFMMHLLERLQRQAEHIKETKHPTRHQLVNNFIFKLATIFSP